MIITSPPYWGLRDYKTEPIVWEIPILQQSKYMHCEHEWALSTVPKRSGGMKSRIQNISKGHLGEVSEYTHGTCIKCGTWKGSLGMEPNPDMFVQHLVSVFEACRHPLKKEGTLWVNLGDTYGGTKQGNTDAKNPNVNTKSFTKRTHGTPNKSLVGIPFRFALAMINKGWILRNTIIWHKPNAMPASAKDRFTVDFEYLFFFSQNKKYFFEQQFEPMKQISIDRAKYAWAKEGSKSRGYHEYCGLNREEYPELNPLGRNMRTVWEISTKSYSGAHFAVFPEELIETPIKAGCPKSVCIKCGTPMKIVYNEERIPTRPGNSAGSGKSGTKEDPNQSLHVSDLSKYRQKIVRTAVKYTFCGCNAGYKSGVVLDPFMGSGTTAVVALKQEKKYIGIELNSDYIKLADERIEPYRRKIRLDRFLFKKAMKESLEENKELFEALAKL